MRCGTDGQHERDPDGHRLAPPLQRCLDPRPNGDLIQDAAIGDGPVDAIFKAVEQVTGIAAKLREFAGRGVTAGKDAQGEVSLELEVESHDRIFRGRSDSTDIIETSAEAYINAVNAILTRRERDQSREVIGRPGAGA
jgi:2-isopropylmalate synthase